MSNQYLAEIHQYITVKIEVAEKEKKTALERDDPQEKSFYERQIRELLEIRKYLTDNIDLKTQRYY